MALNDVIYNKKVDVAQAMPVPVVFAKQNDNAKRKVVVTLVKNGQPFVLGTGVNGYIQGATAPNPVTKRQVKFKRDLTAIDTTQGTATFIITESMTAEIGITQCEVSIYDTEKPQEILCTANINIEVQGTGMSPQDEMASDDYQAIVSIKAEVTAMRDEVRTKTAEAIAAQAAAETAAQNAYNSALGVQKIVAGNEAYTKQEADLKYSVAPRKAQASTTGELKLTDADYGLSYLELQGNSKQYTNTASANLFDAEYNKSLGLDATDKYLRTTGEIDISVGWSYSYYIKVVPNTLYSFVGIPASPAASFVFYTKDKTYISGISTKDAVIDLVRAVTTPNNCEWMRISYGYNNQTAMYLGQPPSQGVMGAVETPSPDYPSEVKSVGDIPKDVNGVEIRNLLDEEWIKGQPESNFVMEGVNNIISIEITEGALKNIIRGTVFNVGEKIVTSDDIFVGISNVAGNWNSGVNGLTVLGKNGIPVNTGMTVDFTNAQNVYFSVFNNTTQFASKQEAIQTLLKYMNNYKFMFTPANTIDEYRPYIGENNGLVKIESKGKNLFPGKGVVIGSIGAGGVPSNNTRVLRTDFIKVDKNKQYVFNPGTLYSGYVYLYDGNKKYIDGLGNTAIFNSGNAEYVILQFNSSPSVEQTQVNVDVMNKTLQLEEGTQTTKYQPYYNQITWIPLREPLRSLPDGTTDVIDKEGNVVQSIDRFIDMKYNIAQESVQIYDGNLFHMAFNGAIGKARSDKGVYCNIMKYKPTSSFEYGIAGSALYDVVYFNLKGKLSENTVELARQFLIDNNATFYCVLKTPIKYQIPAVYIETYDQETNVRCLNKIKPSSMGLDYKIAISSLIKRLEALESAAVNNGGK